MIVGWLLYTVVVGLLLSAAARVLEAGLHGLGWSTRWVWLCVLAAAVVAPLLLLWGPVETPSAPLAVITSLPAIEFAAAPAGENGRWLPSLASVLVGGWAVLSAVLLAIGFVSVVRLARQRRCWAAREVDGVSVLVSRETGPAVVGVRRCEIVVPEWTLALPPADRAYMLRHEEEHARAGDPRLLLVGGLLAVAMPWNPAVWYQLRRLVLAIELDCDRRVLARGGDVGGYAKLLLSFGQRFSNPMLPVTAFAEPQSTLETRIRHMTSRKPRHRIVRLFGLGTAAAAVVVLAGALPVPREGTLESPVLTRGGAGSATTASLVMQVDTPPPIPTDGPVFTPFTVAPTLKNAPVVALLLRMMYPEELRSAGIDGKAQVWFFIDETGTVQKTLIKTSTGNEALDEVALLVAEAMEFTPALNRDVPVKVWVDMPIIFRTDADASSQASARAQTARNAEAARSGGFDIPPVRRSAALAATRSTPRLANNSEVAVALQRLYPPLLRDAGIGGEVMVVFDIDANGRVTHADIGESSGHVALDEAALKVASVMRFEPASDGANRVATRISLPITFRTQ